MIPWGSCVLWLGYPIQNGVWPDVSKHDNDGYITGAFWEGDSLEFDGIDDFVDCGKHTSLNITTNLTIESLVKPTTSFSGSRIVDKSESTVPYPYQLRLFDLYPELTCYEGGHYPRAISPDAVSLNEWSHIVGVKDTSTDRLYIYVDGLLKHDVEDTTVSANLSNSKKVYIAKAGTHWFKGDIALIRIYNQAFTAQQVREAYEQCYRLV